MGLSAATHYNCRMRKRPELVLPVGSYTTWSEDDILQEPMSVLCVKSLSVSS